MFFLFYVFIEMITIEVTDKFVVNFYNEGLWVKCIKGKITFFK